MMRYNYMNQVGGNKNTDGLDRLGKVWLAVNECQELFSVEARRGGAVVVQDLGLIPWVCFILTATTPISCQSGQAQAATSEI